MMKLHDLVLSWTDAEGLAAVLAAHRRGHSPEADPAEALVELLAQARRVSTEALSEDRVAMGSPRPVSIRYAATRGSIPTCAS